MAHGFSGFTVNGISRALERLGFKDTLLAQLSPAARAAIEKPSLFKFHDGPLIDEVMITVAQQRGVDACAQVMEDATQDSIQGVVAPLARMYLTLKGDDPAVLFERFNDLMRAACRGITAQWAKTGPRAGTLAITYVEPVDPRVGHPWRGALRAVLTFCKARGSVTLAPPGADPRVVTLTVQW